MAKVGRPTRYKPEFDVQAYKLSLLGADDKELADFFEVRESTVDRWKLRHPGFCESIKSGKIQADSEVADKLYQRAKGYSHPEDKIFHSDKSGVIIVPTTKHYPPDTGAAALWLKNRRKVYWKDRHDITTDGQPIAPGAVCPVLSSNIVKDEPIEPNVG